MSQHDTEQEKNQNPAHVNHQLGSSQEIGAQEDIQRGHAEESKQQGEGRVDQAAGENYDGRRADGDRGKHIEQYLGYQSLIHSRFSRTSRDQALGACSFAGFA